jgi:hypothetical protein
MKLTPAIKGLLTAAAMIAIALVTYYSGMKADSPFQYLIYAVYAIGISWTISWRNSPSFSGRFADAFGQGFRCFIIVTLLMVAFTGIFSKMHPEFAEESARLYKEQLQKENSLLAPDLEERVNKYKRQYTITLVSASIFGYLIIGAIVTAGVSAIAITTRKK